ncbi:aldehyde dehydrogenase family protein [Caulobacter sp. KR2-114]|jgi:aldehyde dehydrogenase (NAD+)|uniref:aldehyde dehydrogenase family protein n=1 Tax=Caulobacter sp. KR2-114 TaxID=3400912 RepID=UPI003BFEF91A
MRDYRKIYVDGCWSEPQGGRSHEIVNPATEGVAGHITLATAADVDRAVDAARRAFRTYSRTTREDRLSLLNAVLAGFAARRQDLADALVEELGAPAKFALEAQVGTGFLHLATGIEVLKSFAFETQQSSRTVVRREPIGVIGMITPWNWPINQVMCKLVPALATGNTMVHKPSEVTPFTAHIIAEILHDAGVPPGVYNLVDGDGPTVGAAISSHRGVDMVSFTGSTRAGIDVARRGAETVKRIHQELGGKSPNIVLEGADLQKAVGENIYRLMMNSGQTCHAPTRLLVPNARLAEAKAIAAAVVQGVTVGDPNGDVHMGPVVSKRQWTRIQELIRKGVEEGASLVAGGEGRPEGLSQGYYVRPTIFADVTNDMTIAREEIFGPVLCVLGYEDVDQAVAIANDTDYGLGAYVQAADDEAALVVAERLEAGMVYINGASEDPAAPFGGYKMSGNGREWGPMAFQEFVEVKALIRRDAA